MLVPIRGLEVVLGSNLIANRLSADSAPAAGVRLSEVSLGAFQIFAVNFAATEDLNTDRRGVLYLCFSSHVPRV